MGRWHGRAVGTTPSSTSLSQARHVGLQPRRGVLCVRQGPPLAALERFRASSRSGREAYPGPLVRGLDVTPLAAGPTAAAAAVTSGGKGLNILN